MTQHIQQQLKTLLLTSLFGLPTLASAQLLSDALLFSDLQPTGTARSVAIGNAMSALGGDMATANTNPAGLGVYRISEFTFSPVIGMGSTAASFSNESLTDRKTKFSVGNIGLLMHSPLEGKWKAFNVGLAYNRLASYNQNMSFSGVSFGSRIENFVANAQGLAPTDLNGFESQLAYDAYLIDLQDPATNTYVGAVGENNFVRKSQFRRQDGGLHELSMSGAANYNDKLYLGLTLGLDVARYKEFRSYEEFEETGSIDFQQLVFDETRKINGTGINAKFGAIYRINKMFRAAAHIHTPTLFRLTETYFTELMGKIMYQGTLQENTYPSTNVGKYVFGLRSPAVFGLGLAAVVKKSGFVALDLEYLNYKAMKFQVAANDQTATIDTRRYLSDLTGSVTGLYRNVLRARIGTELVFDVFRVRAGYQIQTSPYQVRLSDISDLRHQLSGGLGVRGKNVFFDISYQLTLRQFEYLPYAPLTAANLQRVTAKSSNGIFMATLGFRFD
jgi:hypothetical protein